MRRDDERLADMLDAADKISRRAENGRARFDEDENLQLAAQLRTISGADTPHQDE